MKSTFRGAGSSGALVRVALLAAAILAVAVPGQAKEKRSDTAHCDRHEVAEAITRQLQSVAHLPATQAILPANNPSANYYHLVMREPLETRASGSTTGASFPSSEIFDCRRGAARTRLPL